MGSVCSHEEATTSPARTAPTNDMPSPTPVKRNSRSNSVNNHSNSVARRKVFSTSRMSGSGDVRMPRKVIKSEGDRRLVRTALKEHTLLSALDTYELEEMIDFMEVTNLKGGQEASAIGSLCIVLEGSVWLESGPDASQERLSSGGGHERYMTGDVFGQVGLFHDSLRTSGDASMRACSDELTRICKLPGSAYRQGMEFSRQAQIKANLKLLSSIPIFSKLSVSERVHISDASEMKTFSVGDVIIREGEPGEQFFILRSGGAQVVRGHGLNGHGNGSKPDKVIDYKYPGDYFGEAALLENAPRNATVMAAETGTEALVIGKQLFKKQLLGPLKDIMARSEITLQQEMLVSVPLLSQLPADKRAQLTERLKTQTFADGEFVFKQGDLGDRLYIIKSGEVSVLSSGQLNGSITGSPPLREIDHLYNGQYFGERALIKQEPRMASTRAVGELKCYSLSKDDMESLDMRNEVAWSRRWDMEDTRDVSQLDVIKKMGSGAFGTAWLVVHHQTGRGYALKTLDKHTIKRQNWTSVVTREKNILASLSPHLCVITMHNSFQSPTQLFMLMDLATGGELFQLLERFERFPAEQARFYAACVVLAIGHLHKHCVVFRDLKPENLLLTDTGYLKLIDMGFAKRLGKGEKTYTLCGTPYYLAPEMILHRGHGFALDWWTVGVLTYEIIDGNPPFTGTSEMEVYGKVTRMQYACGHRFPDTTADFISQLLSREPENRLGNLRNGANDVMAHPWFHDFTWDGLFEGTMQPPYKPTRTKLPAPPTGEAARGLLDLSDIMKNPTEFGFWPGW